MAFVSDTPLPSFGPEPSAFDFGSLDALKRRVQHGGAQPAAADQRAVARQFEAVFIQMLLKQARQTAQQTPSLFDSPATRMAQSLQDEQAALNLSDPGLGLADALVAQMQQGQGAQDATLHASRNTQLDAPSGRSVVADSISELIQLITGGRSTETLASVIQGAPRHIQAFVDRMKPVVNAAAVASGVPARLILGQAALESGWGQREIRHPDGSPSHNLFGIKAGAGWTGQVVHVATTEYEDGVPHRVRQPFRAYASDADSVADYVRLISSNSRYRDVMTATSAEEAAQRIQAAGYATDPSYADKLIGIMGYFHAR